MNKTVKNILLRISMFLGISAFVFLIIMAKLNRDDNQVEKIEIGIDDWTGNFLVNKRQVLDVIEENFEVKNKILSGKDLENIEKKVRIIPQVKFSNAYIDDIGNLNIKIIQRKPIIRVYNLQGQSFYIDENGIKFPITNNFTAKVPIVTGNIIETCDTTINVQSKELKKIYKIIQTINKNKLWHTMIGQYNINEKTQIELIPRFGNCTILFGDEKNIEQKISRLDIFYFDVLKKVGWDYYKVINIMYKNQVVCLK